MKRFSLVMWMGLGGCQLADFLEVDEPNCDPRTAFYADDDGDGVADVGGRIYLGCRQPDGYVDEPPPEPDSDDTDDTDVVDTDDTDVVDTDDTDVVDTDVVDTDDTDAPDTDTDTP